jgi:hypothetical protein
MLQREASDDRVSETDVRINLPREFFRFFWEECREAHIILARTQTNQAET